MDIFIKKVYDVISANANVFTAAGLETIKTIDRFRGQTTNPEQFEIFPLPALFIGWKMNWVRNGNYYNATIDIDFHVVIDEPWNTGSIFTNNEEALKHAFYHKVLHTIFDNLESEVTSKLTRLTDTPIDTGVICYTILSYNCNYYEQDVIGSDTIMVGDDATVQITGKLVKQLKPNI